MKGVWEVMMVKILPMVKLKAYRLLTHHRKEERIQIHLKKLRYSKSLKICRLMTLHRFQSVEFPN